MVLSEQSKNDDEANELESFAIRAERYLDDTMSLSQTEAFSLELDSDPRKRNLFKSLCMQYQMLRIHHLSAAVLTEVEHKDLEPIADDGVFDAVISEAIERRQVQEIRDVAERLLENDRRNRRHDSPRHRTTDPSKQRRPIVIPRSLVWLSAAAVIALLAILIINHDNPPKNRPLPEPIVENTAPQIQPAATIHATVDAIWADGARRGVGSTFATGDPVRLESGFIELVTDTSAVLLIEGPCDLSVTSDNQVRIDRGRFVAEVPPKAKYFTVVTPTARVVDYGTEFGVEVDVTGKTDTLVFKGEVELTEVGQQSTLEAAPQARRAVRLHKGWAASVIPGDGLQQQAIEFDTDQQIRFARSIEQAVNPLFHFRRSVLASRPIAYWHFESHGSSRVIHSVAADKCDLHIVDEIDQVESKFGTAIQLANHAGNNIYMPSIDPIYALAGSNQYTISLWFNPKSETNSRLLSLMIAGEEGAPYKNAVALEMIYEPWTDIQNAPAPPNSVRFLHRAPPGSNSATGTNVYGQGVLLNQWNHLVAVKHANRIAIYLNGTLKQAITDKSTIQGVPHLFVGVPGKAIVGDQALEHFKSPFDALIDEISIHDRALTNDEITKQFRLGHQVGSINTDEGGS